MFDIGSGELPLDVLPDPHIVLDAAGVLLAAGASFDRRLLAEPRALSHLATVAESRVELAAELSGRRRIYSATWSPCRWHGETARLVRLIDITDERLHCEALERGIDSLEEALDSLPASLLMVDGQGVITSANARWHVSARANGLSMPNAGIGANYLDLCDRAAKAGEPEAGLVAAGLRAVLDRRSLAFEMEYSFPPIADHPRQWFRLAVSALGTQPGAVIQHHDTTEARSEQEQRFDALAHFKAVFEDALDSIVIYDDDMRILRSNKTGQAFFDATSMGLGEITLFDVVSVDDHEPLLQQHDAMLRLGYSRGLLRLRMAGQEVREIEYAARANVVPGRHVAIARDVTAARQLETQLRQAQKMEALGQLTGGIAHDFNNLLTVVLAHSELLLDDPGLPADSHEGLTQMRRAAQRGADMVRKLMAFGRREQIRLEPTQLALAVQESTELLGRLLPETIQVHFRAPPAVPPVLADANAVQQILLNLATNARDAMREGGGTLKLELRVVNGVAGSDPRQARAGTTPQVIIAVTDTGCGMSAETLARIYEPFFTTKGVGEGTGLGMSMVYGLMEQMGGQVTVESRLGGGTTVGLFFPIVTDMPCQTPPVTTTRSSDSGGTECILLVDDDDAIRRLTARVLRRAGYDVIEADSGDPAARYLSEQAESGHAVFDLVLSDVVMANGDGARVLEATRRWGAGARIVWVTGYAGSGYAAGPVHAPCDAPIIQKPWTTDEFLTRIRAVLDGPPNVPLDATVTHDSHRTG